MPGRKAEYLAVAAEAAAEGILTDACLRALPEETARDQSLVSPASARSPPTSSGIAQPFVS
ncbi:hypothetical protein GCM10027079_08720 [Sediminivirga luteola]|uniref:Uncharacterized protein n=1 Tax=Sediminivirga luteola TaxID=1774748 RepID=A0A8J2XL77_9MICO|nr:hypothetical protein GCM10011333_24430 [Sediminivirga luteola]